MNIRRTCLTGFIAFVLIFSTLATGWAKSCLWKVSDGKNTLYVQGSVHLLKKENYPLPPAITQAYQAADVLVFETDMEAMNDPANATLIMGKAMGGNLKNDLRPEVYQQLEEALTEAGLPIAGFNRFKPWFVGMTLSVMKMQKMGMDPALGLDMHFSNQAKADQKTTVGLETIEFQIDLLASLAELDPNAYILQTLEQLNTLESEMDAMLNDWANGHIDALGELMMNAFADFPSIQKSFVDERNAAWAPQLITYLKSGKTHLVTVGALHLPGPNGLLALLKKQGLLIEQL